MTPAASEPFLERQLELQAVDKAILGYLGVTLPTKEGRRNAAVKVHKRNQPIGWFCGGSCEKDCGAIFGPRLAEVCATCPD